MALPQVFVGYPYAFSKNDYRREFKRVGKEYGVKFIYADEKITNQHVLEKIEAMIEEAEFSIFDVTGWNANVTLELGIVRGKGLDYYILFKPDAEQDEVPSDLGGIDRLQYADYSELTSELQRLMRQQFGAPVKERDQETKARGVEVTETLEAIEEEIPEVVRRDPGLAIGGIASTMGLPLESTKPLVRELLGEDRLRTEGAKRGTKYYPPDRAD